MTAPATTAAHSDRFYIGPADAIEAELGAVDLFAHPFVVYHTYADEGVTIEGFSTLAAAKASLAEIEDRSTIEFVGA